MIKCGRCGNLNAGDVLFCQYCGTRLVEQRLPDVVSIERAPASNRSTDRLIEPSPHMANVPSGVQPLAAAVRGAANQQAGFRLDPGWGIWAGHLVFLAVLVLRPQGLFPKTRG